MTLISLLLVLAIERITTKTRYWQSEYYFEHYLGLLKDKKWLSEKSTSWHLFALIIIPPLLLAVAMQSIGSGFIGFVFNTLILMVCLGSPAVRAVYKCYLQAANRGDLEACDLYAQQLAGQQQGIDSFGTSLVWNNYRYYAAVVMWFVIFGSVGLLFYVMARGFDQHLQERQHPLACQATNIMAILDWLPVRLTAAGFMLVGHYSRALPVWLSYLPDTAVSAKTLLNDVSRAAEEVEPDTDDCTEEACTLVRLAKRNMMFLVVVVAMLTLAGLIH